MGLSHGAKEPLGVTDSLVLYLDAANARSYPKSGTTWFDRSGNSNNGTLVNGPTYSSANFGSLVFDGTNQYGYIPYNANFNLSNTDYTLEGWVNFNTFVNGIALISKDTYGSNYDWAIYIVNSTTIRLYSNNTATSVTATVPTMTTGQWYNIVITSISGVIRIYLNSGLYLTQSMTTSNNSQVYITLGCGSWNSPGGFVNGKMPVLKVYRKGLTAAEVSQNFNAFRGRFSV